MKLFWIEEPIYPPEDYEILKKLSKEIKILLLAVRMLVLNTNLEK